MQTLRICVARHELDPLQMGGDHIVHSVGSGAANSDHGYPWPEFMRYRHAQVDSHSFLTPPPVMAPSQEPLPPSTGLFLGSGSKVLL